MISVEQQVGRDLMESAYRLVHCLSPEFIAALNWPSFVTALESSDVTVKWSVVVFSPYVVNLTSCSSLFMF